MKINQWNIINGINTVHHRELSPKSNNKNQDIDSRGMAVWCSYKPTDYFICLVRKSMHRIKSRYEYGSKVLWNNKIFVIQKNNVILVNLVLDSLVVDYFELHFYVLDSLVLDSFVWATFSLDFFCIRFFWIRFFSIRFLSIRFFCIRFFGIWLGQRPISKERFFISFTDLLVNQTYLLCERWSKFVTTFIS